MTIFAYLALLGWIPAVIAMFAVMPNRKAVSIAVVGAWLILPPYTLQIAGLPDYSKNMAAGIGMLLGTMVFAPQKLQEFRLRWFDLPIVGFSLSGIFSSLYNGLGLYDGLSDALSYSLVWMIPYLMGRIHLETLDDLRYFAVAMVIGGLCYVLPCAYEMRMSPVLLSKVYGVAQGTGMRLGGWRPQVFFWTGLECGMWMTAAALTAWWLWRCGVLKQIGQTPFGPVLLPILLVTAVLCRSTGAILLLLCGIMLLWLSARYRTRLLLACLLLVGPVYAVVRITNVWTGRQAVDLAKAIVGPERAQSLEYRFDCEGRISRHALKQPLFGWGGFARASVYFDQAETKIVPPDGLWMVVLGTKGLYGLTLVYLALVLPAARFVLHAPARLWGEPQLAACSLTVAVLGLYIVDCLMNAFPNIIYFTLAGSLAGIPPRRFRAIATSGQETQATPRRTAKPRAVTAVASRYSSRVMLADRCRTLGRSFKQDGRFDEADDAWRQTLDLLGATLQTDPDANELRQRWCDCANDLAWLRANHPDPSRRDPTSAVSLASQAADAYPDAAAYWNTLGAAHYRAGDDHAAVAALERAKALGRGTPFDDVFLALAHARLGNQGEARQALARAMLQAERDYRGHPELAGLCDEAHSLIAGGAAAVF